MIWLADLNAACTVWRMVPSSAKKLHRSSSLAWKSLPCTWMELFIAALIRPTDTGTNGPSALTATANTFGGGVHLPKEALEVRCTHAGQSPVSFSHKKWLPSAPKLSIRCALFSSLYESQDSQVLSQSPSFNIQASSSITHCVFSFE